MLVASLTVLLRALLLDVDGTLLDTREFILAAFEHAAAVHGFPDPGRDVLARQVGRPLEEIYARLAPGVSEPAVATHRAFQAANLDLVVPFPGACEALAALKARGLALAAVTSRSHRTALPSLEVAGLADTLDVVIAAEDAPALKPDPAPVLLALARLGCEPAAALMVGDTEYDVLAGRAAGVVTVAATYGLHGTAVLEAEPDWQLESIAELVHLVGALQRA